jgi:hypothetical protein
MRKLLFAVLLLGYLLPAKGQEVDSLAKPVRMNDYGKLFYHFDAWALILPDYLVSRSESPFSYVKAVFSPKIKFGIRYGLTPRSSIEAGVFLMFYPKDKIWNAGGIPTVLRTDLHLEGLQYRGVTNGIGGELRYIFHNNHRRNTYIKLDYQRKWAKDVTWVYFSTSGPDVNYKVDIISTRFSLALGKETLLKSFSKDRYLNLSYGLGVILNTSQIYIHNRIAVNYSSYQSIYEKRNTPGISPHLNLGLRFYFKAK